jgi:8-oxo-dGTP pyrophosphatase MutT (NUDIX family)
VPVARMIVADRASRHGQLSIATSAVVFDPSERVLLARRRDTGLWCLPGGIMEPGESVAEAVVREVREETGFVVAPVQLIGVYSNPDLLVSYPDGRKHHPVVLCFRCKLTGGGAELGEETLQVGFHPLHDLPPLVPQHHQRLEDARAGREAAFVR